MFVMKWGQQIDLDIQWPQEIMCAETFDPHFHWWQLAEALWVNHIFICDLGCCVLDATQ